LLDISELHSERFSSRKVELGHKIDR